MQNELVYHAIEIKIQGYTSVMFIQFEMKWENSSVCGKKEILNEGKSMILYSVHAPMNLFS